MTALDRLIPTPRLIEIDHVDLGAKLVLHPNLPPLPVVALVRGCYFVAHAAADPEARATGKSWIEATWLFFIESLEPACCRFISRYRVESSNDIATRLFFGQTLIEPVGFAMDRRMLLGVKERAERARRARAAVHRIGR